MSVRELDAGIVVIGNEILSGKTVDTNSPFLAKELREIGVTLKRVIVIPDELDIITQTVRDFHRQFDIVFTSGGVGPTHDDITIEGVARALERQVICHPVLEEKLRSYLNGRPANSAYLKMAEAPEGAELIEDGAVRFPTIKVENVYVLPGIPDIFRQKFLALKGRFAADPYYLKVLYTREYESVIAGFLNETLREYPEVMLGSYPKNNDPEYRVKITLESKDRHYVNRAFQHLITLLPEGCVVKTEG